MSVFDHPVLAAILLLGTLAGAGIIVVACGSARTKAALDAMAADEDPACSDFGGEPPAVASPEPGQWPVFDGRR